MVTGQANFLPLVAFFLYSNRARLIGSALMVTIPLGYLLLLYFNSPIPFTTYYYSQAEDMAQPVFLAAFSLMVAQAFSDKSEKFAVMGPYTRMKVLIAVIVSTILLATSVMFLTVVILSIVNYFLTTLANQASSQGTPLIVPPLTDIVIFWVKRYLGQLGLYGQVMLVSLAAYVWGARRLGESLNTLFTLFVSFFGTLFQLSLLFYPPGARYFTFVYYMYALGSIITGLHASDLGVNFLQLPGYLPVSIAGIILTFLILFWIAWEGFRRLDVGAD